MPRRNWKLRISDILGSVQAGQEYTEGMKYEDFKGDRVTFDIEQGKKGPAAVNVTVA